MQDSGNENNPSPVRSQHFATTSWSIVVAAGSVDSPEAGEAIRSLCESYWLPVYSFVRRTEQRTADAQDLTQEFFCFLLENDTFCKADQERGRFRSFLLTTLKHFLVNQRNRARAEKRGGERRILSLDFQSGESHAMIDLAHDLTPEKVFERRWVLTLLDQVVDCLKRESAGAGKELQFEQLKRCLTEDISQQDYGRAGETLGISGAAAKQAAYRLRKRYRELFRAEVARTVADDSEIDDETGRLLQSLGD